MYFLAEFVKKTLVEHKILRVLSLETSCQSQILREVWGPILFLDVFKKLLNVIELNVTEKIEQKGADCQQAGIKSVIRMSRFGAVLNPAHLVAFASSYFHLELSKLNLNLLQGRNQADFLVFDHLFCFYWGTVLFLGARRAVEFGDERRKELRVMFFFLFGHFFESFLIGQVFEFEFDQQVGERLFLGRLQLFLKKI